ncbi:flagellar hook-length control protein FliK [Brevibacillus borstelensis]|uniref:flagellar hook-length control protein FliK n=1 Tax=Brevibacillus borstelensis TaxID=45462 RepID=UPI001D0BBF25|nr:flagellar hook-length control protein FliK [Brevibacillus borstelensis]MCC0563449.1 flagellar hook-length control protein FliK [Brevibacillus borstelensis]
MNVANVAAPAVPASVGTSANGSAILTGTVGQQLPGTLENLFAMQMMSALEQLEGMEDAVIQVEADGMDTEDQEEIAELLAMLQQLFATSQSQSHDIVNSLEAKTKELADMMNKLPKTAVLSDSQVQNLLATFTQRGLSQATAEKLANFMAALNQSNETMPQGLVPARSKEQSTAAYMSQRTNLMSTMQPVRVSHALSSYQAEAGVQAKTAAPTSQQQTADFMMEPDANPLTAQQNNPNVQTFGQKGNVPTGGHPIHANQFSQQVTQLFVKQMKLTQVDGVHEARLILYPQSLGQVDVKITSHNGMITAHFSAETTAGKELLDNQLPQLRAALTQQGLQVDRLEVNQQQQAGSLPFQQQQRERQQQQNNENQQSDRQDKAEFSLDALVEGSDEISKIGYSG